MYMYASYVFRSLLYLIILERQRHSTENFRKLANNVLEKIAKWHYFSVFSNNVKNPSLNFHALGRKINCFKNFEIF